MHGRKSAVFWNIIEQHLPDEHLDEEDKEIESKFGEVNYE